MRALALLLFLVCAAQAQSPVVRKACDADVIRLCPREYKDKDNAGVGECMRRYWKVVTVGCALAYCLENKAECKFPEDK